LHDLDRAAFDAVFEPAGLDPVPGYLLRPVPPDAAGRAAVEWFLFGTACAHDRVLCRAWDVASGRGLGPQRQPFIVRGMVELNPLGRPTESAGPWPLSCCGWPADPQAPCRLAFVSPLRLLRHKQLIERPALPDLVVSAHRRVRAFLPAELVSGWDTLRPPLLEAAQSRPAAWQGGRQDLQRYSARQGAELELRGVSGVLDLPQGPGGLWPLLAAAAWLHLGKATVFGLGQLEVQPWPA
jgi:hypothetical protein